jgi:hypothetical protein
LQVLPEPQKPSTLTCNVGTAGAVERDVVEVVELVEDLELVVVAEVIIVVLELAMFQFETGYKDCF